MENKGYQIHFSYLKSPFLLNMKKKTRNRSGKRFQCFSNKENLTKKMLSLSE